MALRKVFISIIIPTYNSAGTISRALQSILSQTFQDYEVLVLDNKSTDNTLEVVNGFNDNRIRVWSEADRGVYDAMNKGIRFAKGDWLYFLGSDDEISHARILEQVAIRLGSIEAKFVYGNVLVRGDSYWAKNNTLYDGEFSVEKLFIKNICHQAIFYSRDLFQKIGIYNPDYRVCADWDFNHRCFALIQTAYIPETIAFFTGGGKSSSATSDKYSSEDCIINLRAYYNLSYTNSKFQRYARVFLNNATKYLANGQLTKSLYFFIFALFHSKNRIYFIKHYLLMLRTCKLTKKSV